MFESSRIIRLHPDWAEAVAALDALGLEGYRLLAALWTLNRLGRFEPIDYARVSALMVPEIADPAVGLKRGDLLIEVAHLRAEVTANAGPASARIRQRDVINT